MTIKLYIPDLREVAANRPPGYLDEVLAAGRVENEIVLHIEHEKYLELIKKYSPKQEMPSMTMQAKSLLGAVGKAIINPTPVSKEEYERRLVICHDCEFLKDKIRCLKCGCRVNWKARLETWHCPIKKW